MQLAMYASTPSGVRAVPLYKRGGIAGFAWVDEADYEIVSKHRWYLKHGYAATSTYPYGRGRAVTVYMQRLLLGLERGDKRKCDHRDHNTLDNRRKNIRVCTHAENHQNRRRYGDKNSSSIYRGVSWRKKARKWQAYAYLNGKVHHLGFFEKEADAGKAAADFRREHMPFSTS